MEVTALDPGLTPDCFEGDQFVRPPSAFRDRISTDGTTPYPAEVGRYHLYVSLACPWSHRTVIVRVLKGLEGIVSMSTIDPIRDERGWAFTGGEFEDPVNGFKFLSEAYMATDDCYAGRISVPVLWDRVSGRIVNNESSDVVAMFNQVFDGLGATDLDLRPKELVDEMDVLAKELYDKFNNGVTKAGFARSQRAYEAVVMRMFPLLDELELRLGTQRYLMGERFTEIDWRAFVTLVRFDAVYYSLYKCNVRRIVDYRNLWGYTRELYQQPGIAATVAMDQIKRSHHINYASLNPSGIVPVGPELDFEAPHGRG